MVVRQAGLVPVLKCHCLEVWPWPSHLTTLSFSKWGQHSHPKGC